MSNVFESIHYISFLNAWVRAQPKGGRGARSALAHAANCQLTYLSRVLVGRAHLSLEQAEGVSRFLGHTEEERDYFLLLVQHDRAGTKHLKAYFKGKLTEAQNRRLVLKDRFKVKMSLSSDEQATYYSQWFYAAIHVLLSIPELQSKDGIARYLGLPKWRVSEMVDFLVSTGLAKEEAGRVKMGVTRIHLGSDSPLLPKHHINWRLKAIQALERSALDRSNVHYSSIVTVSQDDALKISAMLVDMMERFNSIVSASPEEVGQCLAIDFFRI